MNFKRHAGIKIHIPVMPKEVISFLNIIPDGIYIDGTIGLGGHSSLILSHLSNKGHLIGIDRDEEALNICKKSLTSSKKSISLFHDSYHNIESILDSMGIKKVNGILLDLGLSSLQLDSNTRGFSYKSNSVLDMRYDLLQKIKATDILNKYSEKKLADVIYSNGEERKARAIARTLLKMRPLKTSFDLIESIRRSTPPKNRNKSIARVFQAIRIEVNRELEKLDSMLKIFSDRIIKGGRIVIISFHSLEDRRVKHSFRQFNKEKKIKTLTKKPLRPSSEEIMKNSRSSSAKLRAAEKI